MSIGCLTSKKNPRNNHYNAAYLDFGRNCTDKAGLSHGHRLFLDQPAARGRSHEHVELQSRPR